MWVISGPFDGQEKNEVGFKKAKLLKTGSRYSLGRKERQLIVNHAKVSHDHCAFTVAPYSQEDVGNSSTTPNLSINNAGKKPMTIARGDESITLNPSSIEELRDGDVINIIVGVPLGVKWISVCCLVQVNRGKSMVSLDACASLGINVLFTSHSSITHHLIPQYAANPVIATSLLSAAQFVKPEWLNELVRLGSLPVGSDPSNGSSLEQVFTLPPETKFRPTFATALPASLKVFKAWEPNEERVNMFRGYRFLFVGEKGREVEEMMTELVRRGGGEREVFSVDGGRQKLHRILAKGKAKLANMPENKKGLVLVADAKAIVTAVGSKEWEELVDEANDFGLRFVAPDAILQAVLHVDITYISASYVTPIHEPRSSSPLPDFVPNTHPEEPSYPPVRDPEAGRDSSKRQKGQATPSAVSRPSTPPQELESNEGAPTPPPRKLLKRRAKVPPPAIIGIDDPSVIEAAPVAPAATSSDAKNLSVLGDLTASIPTRSSRLKRRAGTIASSLANTQTAHNENVGDIGQEPPLKKFKALFDASHPDQNSGQDFDDRGLSYSPDTFESRSITQSGTQLTSTSGGLVCVETRLAAVVEEEEESGSNRTRDRQTKRKLNEDNNTEMTVVEDEAGFGATTSELGPTAKRRAIENVNAIEPSRGPADGDAIRSKPSSVVATKSASKSGAATGKPDTDVAFLKAVASTKKGKKAEDSFDREFNKLKISKPDVQRDDQEKEWAVLDDFEEERNIRGNFMVVLEMDIYSKEQEYGNTTMRLEWQERPNFKKFKKKSTAGSRPKVELVVNEENDYGMGSVYWKNNSQSQSQGSAPLPGTSQSQTSKLPHIRTETTRQGKTRAFTITDSDEDEDDPVPRKGKAALARATQNPAGTSRVPHTEAKSQPLFLDSDDHGDASRSPKHDEADNDEDAKTLQSSGPKTQKPSARLLKPASTKRAKRAPVIVDDDSDDGATFKGFRGKK